MMMSRDAREGPPTFVGAGGAKREVGTQIPKTERSLNECGAATDSGRRQLREGRDEGRGHLSRTAPAPPPTRSSPAPLPLRSRARVSRRPVRRGEPGPGFQRLRRFSNL